MKVLSSLLLLLFSFLPLAAQERLAYPLTFVDADSIVIWESGKADLRGTALSVDAGMTARRFVTEEKAQRQYKHLLRSWKEEILPAMNLVGGSGDEATEPQAVAASRLVQTAAPLLLLTADSRFADALECAAYNALPVEVQRGAPLSFDKRMAARALLDAVGTVYATDEEGVYVNLYVNSSTHIRTPHLDLVLDQLTAMPHAGRVKLRLTGLRRGGSVPLKLRLRIPGWATGRLLPEGSYVMADAPAKPPTVYVNGREEFFNMERGYLVISRLWNSGDEVLFDLPFTPRMVRKAGQEEVALMRGPLLYALTDEASDCYLPAGAAVTEKVEPDRHGNTLLDVVLRRAEGTEVHAEARPYQTKKAAVWLPEAK